MTRLPTVVALGLVYGALALPVAGSGEMPATTVVASVVLAGGLLLLSAIDLETFRLPDQLTLPLVALGIGLAGLLDWDSPWARLGAAAAGFGALWLISVAYQMLRDRAGLGLGDAKLLAASGAWTGFEGLSPTLLVACLTALFAVAVMAVRRGGIDRRTAIPFGPFLALGTWVVWLYGPIGL